MARLRLTDRETRARYLPKLCMVCGESSETHIKKNFSWFPPWIAVTILFGWLPYVILVIVLTKRMTVDVPTCHRHSGHFWKRTLLIWFLLIGSIGVGVLAFVAAAALAPQGGGDDDSGVMFACLFSVFLLIGLIIAIAIIQYTAIRPKQITDYEIHLIKVHDRFVEAFEELGEQRRFRRDDDDDPDEFDRPPGRRPRTNDDDDD